MTWVENFAHAAMKYADTEMESAQRLGRVADTQVGLEWREALMAAYLSGCIQLAQGLAKMDGDAPHPTKLIAAIEEAGIRLLGHGSEPPDNG